MSNSMPSTTPSPSCCEPDDGATFTCPICLFEKPAVCTPAKHYDVDVDDDNNSRHDADADDTSCPIFQLSSCHHKFCTACLRAYVRSKLFDGEVDIPCCHFKLSSNEDDFHQCNVLLDESDIDHLLHTLVDDDDESNKRAELFCTSDDPCYDIFGSKISRNNNVHDNIADQLWTKYQKLKFDLHHGRDTVRRCPNCDEAQLFDEEVMKQFQSTFLTQQENAAPVPDVPTSNLSTGKNTLRIFQRRQRDVEDVPSRVSERNDETVEDVRRENDREVSFGTKVISPSMAASIDNDKKTSSSQDDRTGKEPPLDSNLEAETPQDENTALVKSTIPVVTCLKCNTEFCYFHSNAHSGSDSTGATRMSCIEYHNKSLELDRANVDFASRILRAKSCPTCGISVSKEGGCNQIKCGSCGTHFCWLCGAIVDDGAFPEHFRWWNLRGCANMQLDENTEPLRCTIWAAKLMSGFQIIVLGIPAVVLTLVSMALCPCMVPSCGNTNRERVVNCVSFWGSFLSSLLMLPFTCLGMILLLALSCFVAALSSLSKFFAPNYARSHREPTATSRNTNVSDPDDLMREIGSMLDRMEEGRTTLSE